MKFRHAVPFVSGVNKQETLLWLKFLAQAMPDINVVAFDDCSTSLLETTQVAVVANPDSKDLYKMPNLKWVQSVWAGVEKLMAYLPEGILIARLEDPELDNAMAEAVLTNALFIHRKMHLYAKQQQERRWFQHNLKAAVECCVGLLGLGKLGLASGRVLQREGFNVCGWSRSKKTSLGFQTYSGDDGLSRVLKKVDILVLLLPLTPQTRHLIDRKALSLMKPEAAIINFARGGIIDTDALIDSLNRQQLEHAILDVFEQEPLPEDSPLWGHPAITVLPHISAPTNKQSASKIVATHLHDWFESEEMPKLVDRTRGY